MIDLKEKSLNESVEFNEKEKARLTNELDVAIVNYDQMKYDLESQISTLETEIAHYTAENDKYSKEITELNPIYDQLCKLFRETVKDYEETKKVVISKL